ncbi:hypothetical protein [Dyella sp.]|uniref:hypothetical protein n=1 Tax=Dyella sp. TaxID=1869338 RepID=UPI002ED1EF9A
MNDTNNPYAAPSAYARQRSGSTQQTEQIISGQKQVIYAMLLYMLAGVASSTVAVALGGLIGLASLAMGLIGVWRLCTGLGHGVVLRVLWMILLFLPLIGLLLLLILNGRATRYLRDAGYSVGLMGART